MAVSRETELYEPVKSFFVRRGYDVKAEVRGCDLVARRPDEDRLAIVEMKKTFTLPLLLQGAKRQLTGAAVWLAVERNRARKGAHNQRFGEITALCRRLGLGLLTVTFYKTKEPALEVWCEPWNGTFGEPPQPLLVREGRRSAGAARIEREFMARSGDYNVGGSTRRKLVTAYRERALRCALALRCHGPSSPSRVAGWTGCPNAGSLLRDNHYGWFRRQERGIYALTEAGDKALREYGEVVAAWASQYPWASVPAETAAASGGREDA